MNIKTMTIERNEKLISKILNAPRQYSERGIMGVGLRLFPASVSRLLAGRKKSRVIIAQDAANNFLIEKSDTPHGFIVGNNRLRAVFSYQGSFLSILPIDNELAYELAKNHLRWALPQPIGNKKPSFGWGNRTLFSTEVVLATCRDFSDYRKFNRVTAQNSIRENQILERYDGFRTVMADALLAKMKTGYRELTGSDADHLKSFDEIQDAIHADFTGFTLDPSLALKATPEVVARGKERTVEEIAADSSLNRIYRAALRRNRINQDFLIRTERILRLKFPWIACGDTSRDAQLIKAVAVKFADSWTFMTRAYKMIKTNLGANKFDFEASFDETAQPTDYLSHFITANELKTRGIPVTRFAVKYIGRFEKTTEWIPPKGGNVTDFKRNYERHQKIARHYGYLQSIHSGSGKYNIFKYCSMAHLKTSGDISRPIILGFAENNFPAFCHLFHDMVDSATDTKKLYGAVSSHSNDFPKLHKQNPVKIGKRRVVQLLRKDLVWRTFSHYAYGTFKHHQGTINELTYACRDHCAGNIAEVLKAHRRPIYAANGFRLSKK